MSGPDLLERVRMCLAEVGEDPGLVCDDPAEAGGLLITPSANRKVFWRAASLARSADGSKQMCWTCSENPWPFQEFSLRRAACEATRPCMEDCGRDRSQP